MSVRLPIALTALVATFAAGVAASQLWVHEAHDAHGGVFELYDEREQPVTRVRAESFARVPPGSVASPVATRRPNGDPDLGF